MEIVTQYTASAMTRETDRKDALVGVITVLSTRTGLSFSHGVCTTFFPYSLLWEVWWLKDLSVSGDAVQHPPYKGPSWSGTFRSETIVKGLHHWEGQKKGNSIASICSLDEQASIVSIKAMHSGIRMIKSDPGPVKSNLREALRVRNLHESWTDYHQHEIFDKEYHEAVEAIISMDYNGFDPIAVEFILLIGNSNVVDSDFCADQDCEFEECRHKDLCVAYGLVLTGNIDINGLWKRVGTFVLTMNERPKNKSDRLEYILSPFKSEREFRIC